MSTARVDRRRFIGLAAGTALASAVGSQWSTAEPAAAKQKAPTTHEYHRAVVVGTGFGGAIAAYHLARAGVETVVLERGRRWDVTGAGATFPRFLHPDHRVSWMRHRPVFPGSLPALFGHYAGLVDRVEGRGMNVLCGAGVGGSSLIFAGMMLKPTEELFQQVFPPEVSYADMHLRYYPRVARRLGIARVPEDIFAHKRYASSRVFLQHAQEAGLPAATIPSVTDWDVVRRELVGEIEQSASVGDYLYGVNSGARNSVDRNYLHRAEQSPHVTVQPLHMVTRIRADSNGRYLVHCDRISERSEVLERKVVMCDALFLGAGAMGTSPLLVRAREIGDLPELNEFVGTGWGNNGNRIYTRVGVHGNTRAHQGGPPCVAITDWHNPDTPIAIEHGGAPLPFNAHVMSLIAVGGIPDKRGHFTYDAQRDRVKLHWPKHADETAERAGRRVVRRLVGVGGGLKFDNSPHGDVSFHPLGGAVLGSACDTYGRVHGYRGLYVLDGSLVPGSTPGCNPAWTIAALAERGMDDIMGRDFGPVF